MSIEPLVRNLIRAALKVVPVLGSTLDQLSFGIYDSLKLKEYENDLERIHDSIVKLILDKRTEEEIIRIIVDSNSYKILNEKVTELTRNKTLIARNQELLNQLKIIQQDNFSQVQKTIETIKNEFNHDLKLLNETIDVTRELQKLRYDKHGIKFKVQWNSLLNLDLFVRNLLDLTKRKYWSGKKLLLDSDTIFECTHFPNKEKIVIGVNLLYALIANQIELAFLKDDINEILKIKRNLEKLNPRYSLKHKTIPSSIAFGLFNSLIEKLEIVDSEVSDTDIRYRLKKIIFEFESRFKASKNAGTRDFLFREIRRFIFLSRNGKWYFRCNNVSSRKSKFVFRKLKTKNHEEFGMNSLSIALYSFLISYNWHERFSNKRTKETLENIISIIDEGRINGDFVMLGKSRYNEFIKGLKSTLDFLELFKSHIKFDVFERLKFLHQQEKEYMKMYEDFSRAYFEIESLLLE